MTSLNKLNFDQTKSNVGNAKSNNNTSTMDSSAEDSDDEDATDEPKETHDEVSLHTTLF